MSLADRIVPSKALRWGRLTKCWPWSDANPAVGPIVDPAALWGEHDRLAEGRGHPLDLAAVVVSASVVIRPPARSWLPWRKRR